MPELYQDPVMFQNHGKRILGLLHFPDGGKPAAVIMNHGWTGNMHSHGLFVECARQLCEDGFMVLRYDFCGSEHSEGSFEGMTVRSEVSDFKAALKVVADRGCDPARIGALGYSLGSLVSMIGWDRRVKAMVLWSSTLRPVEVFTGLVGQKGLRQIAAGGHTWYRKDPSPYRRRVRFKVGRPFFREIKRVDVTAKAGRICCPISIIHGDKDDVVSVNQSRELFSLINDPKRLTVIEGANHFFETEEQRKRLYETTREWLRKWLL